MLPTRFRWRGGFRTLRFQSCLWYFLSSGGEDEDIRNSLSNSFCESRGKRGRNTEANTQTEPAEASEGSSSKLKSDLYTTNMIPHLQITALVVHVAIYMCNTFTFISVPAGLKIQMLS